VTHDPAVHLDAIDQVIMECLRRDGRMSYTDMAREVGLTAPAVRGRMNRLIEQDVFQIVAIANPLVLGNPVMALVGIRVDGNPSEVADNLGALPGVLYLVRTAGSFDLFAELMSRSNEELGRLVDDQIRTVAGVRNVETFPYFGIHTERYNWTITD
jgi:Lrp/AsnC family transcriptional regulator for asnA, asnC and gidA